MKKLALVLLSISFLICHAQYDESEIITSQIFKHNKPRIYVEDILGEQDGIVYVLYSTEPRKTTPVSKLFVKMYDKEDMGLVKSVALVAPGSSMEKKYKDLYYYDHLITPKGIQFFFRADGKKGTIDVFLSSYNLDMKLLKKAKRMLNYDPKDTRFFGLSHPSYPYLVMATLNRTKKSDDMFLEYKIIDKEFKVVKSNKMDLPYKSAGRSGWFGGTGSKKRSFSNNLRLNSAGNIITSISIDKRASTSGKKKRKKAKMPKGEDRYYRSIIIIDTEKEDIMDVPIRLSKNKNIDDFSWISDGTHVTVTGFYADLMKDKKGNEIHGIFYIRVNSITGEEEVKRTVLFPKDFLHRINSQNTLVRRRRQKKETEKESINEAFQITDVILDLETKTLTAYCEPINNYSVTTTDSKGNSRTTYHSDRGSAFYFKVNGKGDFDFYNTIRKVTKWASGSSSVWYRKSMHVYRSSDGKTDYLFYYTQRIYNPQDKKDLKGEKTKWKHVKRDFVIAKIDQETGGFDLNYPKQFDKKLKNHYSVGLESIVEHNGELYAYSTVGKMRISRIITAVVGAPLLFIPTIVVWMSPKSYYQKIQLYHVKLEEEEDDGY